MSFNARYEKVTLLGEGAFGAAYLIKPKSGRREALQVAKEIRTSHLTEKQREAALAESEVLKMMEHPNIIAYVDSFLDGPRLYIVMEYADGGDLATKIKDRKERSTKFEERDVMFVFVQVALALIHIHSRKVLHRDLKPLNIFLTKKGIVKLGDFGIARVLDSTSAGAQTTIGTPHYLSPEMVNNEEYGTKSDLWSLGVVTYELAALRVPFHGTSLPAVAMKIMGAEPEPLPTGYSSDLTWIVMGLLNKDPSKRPRLENVQRMPFVQKVIEVLLSHSLAHGAGGCEAMTSANKRPPSHPPSGGSDGPPSSQAIERRHDKVEAAREEFIRNRQLAIEAKCRDSERDSAIREEFMRNRQIALEGKRRESEGFEYGSAAGSARRQNGSRSRPPHRPREDSPPAALTGKQREAEVRRRAQAQRDELDAARRDELNRAMREAAEERRQLTEKIAMQQEMAARAAEADDGEASDLDRTVDAAEAGRSENAGRSGRPRDAKHDQEAAHLRALEQARLEHAEEQRRLVEKMAAMQAADEEAVAAGSGEEVDSDRGGFVCLVPKKARLPETRQELVHDRGKLWKEDARGQQEAEDDRPMVLEIPFTDTVRPKPRLSSQDHTQRLSVADAFAVSPGSTLAPRGRGRGRAGKPPTGRRSAGHLLDPNESRASGGRISPAQRASGHPAQWLRSQSEGRSVMEKLDPPEASYARNWGEGLPNPPKSPVPPTPKGSGDVSQLQDALAHALCGVEGRHSEETIPEEIFDATLAANEVPTLIAGSSQASEMLVNRGGAPAKFSGGSSMRAGSGSRRRGALEDSSEISVLTDWKETGESAMRAER
eukprot:TRINITY_DN102241_c0_g1_i1.p1 TRINITY_DN102241_c0_g1~~TRINITY_DN102241_c0_g1_i1.p1  ORF type:complete len:828 (-),score=184.35 TRINITY_DN102241_c0_g1_i1:50-2533(-)